MQIKSHLTAAALASVVAADCFEDMNVYHPDLKQWKDPAYNAAVKKVVEKACNDGTLHGDYDGNNNDGKGHKEVAYQIKGHEDMGYVQLQISRLGKTKRTLPPAECISGLTKEVRACSWGGLSDYWNWEYIATPESAQSMKADMYPMDQIKDISV
ncbi:Uu.00g013230.m01.CDS01 [Anthostomella pinea]|uniref:Uu.00g013230.m01.CDS01 n=1 Tax=Anthostomella pinea TaxID=933095 RepID=A0AAI8YQ56_9PEZI|nr:Uu.00g013230.m01.CDS01 [Anthostomella pinea]